MLPNHLQSRDRGIYISGGTVSPVSHLIATTYVRNTYPMHICNVLIFDYISTVLTSTTQSSTTTQTPRAWLWALECSTPKVKEKYRGHFLDFAVISPKSRVAHHHRAPSISILGADISMATNVNYHPQCMRASCGIPIKQTNSTICASLVNICAVTGKITAMAGS